MRTTVSVARTSSSDENESDSLRNLAYVVSSANDNITSLRQTVKQQEKELQEKGEQAAALQRNYETLSRIRQADQKEFSLLKGQKEEQEQLLLRVQEELATECERSEELETRLHEVSAAQSKLQELRLELREVERQRDAEQVEAGQARRQVAELTESSKALKLNLDKLMRVQQEMLARSRKADDERKQLQAEKEAVEKEAHRLGSKLAVQERQLRTFLSANEALENDLREQMQQVAAAERRKQEWDAERQTVEAYYNARIEEMQAEYDKLLAETEGAGRHSPGRK